ncbi:hypothetical protein I215_06497 [Galbibacter marinus]|uniref:Uncharacterized protein n=1 Tax=Galbibacter marinus TaxID=555500 RepID=K2P3F3_9FLAO|nr:hypothetical protein [Galbibacter marinus]EKF55588.1 hypothetical protein I215_06497 [Galbibacter marinus]
MKTAELTYIDWNLFSILKEPKLSPHIILNDFLKRESDKITLVYSDAHLGDLAKTSGGLSSKRINDLTYLSEKAKDLVIVKYFGRDYVDVENRNALEFYEQNVYDNSIPMAGSHTAIKQMTDTYGSLRDDIIKIHFKLDPKSICNFSASQLDELIKMLGISGSLKEFIEFGLSLRGDTSTHPLTYIDYYTTAYMNLDLIGFFPDSMNEKGEYSNLLNDAKHSAYGSICKAFITNDNKCYHKSKLLFEYFKSQSKLIKTCKIKNGTTELEKELNSLTE